MNGMVNSPVLVLNQNYEPLNVCNARRAFVLVDRGKADVLEHHDGLLRSPSHCFSLPSVIRLIYLIRRPRPQIRLTRKEIFSRDHYTCQYCGRHGHDLTLDHVIPRNKGGAHTWDNLVSACKPCNHHKAGKMPSETRMRLLHQPKRPPATAYYLFYDHLERQVEWQKFIPGWEVPNGYS
jgi:5-methylcytosine-specific restriction endonuclease McrA